MFDKTTLVLPRDNGGPSHVTVKVHEHRAPTDESVRVLRELEDAAYSRCTDRMVSEAGANTLGAVLFDTTVLCEDWSKRHHVVFMLNGEKFDLVVKTEDGVTRVAEVEVAEGVAKAIAAEIVARQMVRMVRK